jgi:antitoxin component of MazEF toxin-antitoxin module
LSPFRNANFNKAHDLIRILLLGVNEMPPSVEGIDKIRKIGDSLVVAIPGEMIHEMHLKEGDDIILLLNEKRQIMLEKPASIRYMNEEGQIIFEKIIAK